MLEEMHIVPHELQSNFSHVINGHGFLMRVYKGLKESTRGTPMSTVKGPFTGLLLRVAYMTLVSISCPSSFPHGPPRLRPPCTPQDCPN